MKLLEQAIINKGKVLPGNILKVGSFLNAKVDVSLAVEMGKEFYRHFKDCEVTKILTVEASGIGISCITAQFFNCDVVFGKKSTAVTLGNDVYTAQAFSFTHKNTNTIVVDKSYLDSTDRVLIIDDFLATGEAVNALMDIVRQAGATLVGVGIQIEKGFQGAGDKYRKEGINLCSLAVIDKMDEQGITFRN